MIPNVVFPLPDLRFPRYSRRCWTQCSTKLGENLCGMFQWRWSGTPAMRVYRFDKEVYCVLLLFFTLSWTINIWQKGTRKASHPACWWILSPIHAKPRGMGFMPYNYDVSETSTQSKYKHTPDTRGAQRTFPLLDLYQVLIVKKNRTTTPAALYAARKYTSPLCSEYCNFKQSSQTNSKNQDPN